MMARLARAARSEAAGTTSGLVFDIQRFSVHDGPGIRTTVFFKGCSLRCFWCHNPEGLRLAQEVEYYPSRCIGCGECVAVCPQGAQQVDDGSRVYRRELCITCGECVGRCYAEGLLLAGREMTAVEVIEEVLRDLAFYETSGGGVTLSGGDPVVQPAFARAILEGCRGSGLHTALETAANCPWDHLAGLLPFTDLLMMDLKHMDPVAHRAATGVSNERILENARLAARTGVAMLLRVPVVPGFNDTPEEVAAIARFAHALAAEVTQERPEAGARRGRSPIGVELLPFHGMAADKYRSLGLEYRATHLQPPSAETMVRLRSAVESALV